MSAPVEQILAAALFAAEKHASQRRKGAAGIPYIVDGPDGPLLADSHALRHTSLPLGGRAEIPLRTPQELAGDSTPTLTTRYSHRRLEDLSGAVGKLPRFLPTSQHTWCRCNRPVLCEGCVPHLRAAHEASLRAE